MTIQVGVGNWPVARAQWRSFIMGGKVRGWGSSQITPICDGGFGREGGQRTRRQLRSHRLRSPWQVTLSAPAVRVGVRHAAASSHPRRMNGGGQVDVHRLRPWWFLRIAKSATSSTWARRWLRLWFLERPTGSGPCPFCRGGGPLVSGNCTGGGSRMWEFIDSLYRLFCGGNGGRF